MVSRKQQQDVMFGPKDAMWLVVLAVFSGLIAWSVVRNTHQASSFVQLNDSHLDAGSYSRTVAGGQPQTPAKQATLSPNSGQ
jgi:hypothetical protein